MLTLEGPPARWPPSPSRPTARPWPAAARPTASTCGSRRPTPASCPVTRAASRPSPSPRTAEYLATGGPTARSASGTCAARTLWVTAAPKPPDRRGHVRRAGHAPVRDRQAVPGPSPRPATLFLLDLPPGSRGGSRSRWSTASGRRPGCPTAGSPPGPRTTSSCASRTVTRPPSRAVHSGTTAGPSPCRPTAGALAVTSDWESSCSTWTLGRGPGDRPGPAPGGGERPGIRARTGGRCTPAGGTRRSGCGTWTAAASGPSYTWPVATG